MKTSNSINYDVQMMLTISDDDNENFSRDKNVPFTFDCISD